MDKEMNETVLQAVDYTNTEAERYNKRVRICNGIATLFILCLDQEGKRADAVVVVGFWICAVRMPDKGQRSGPYGQYARLRYFN